MRVKSIHLEQFKRFTDLTIRDIPESAKLVVVVGPNGCGKSSLFDAFLHWHRMHVQIGHDGDNEYFYKKSSESSTISSRERWFNHSKVIIDCYDKDSFDQNSFYARTAYRHDPDLDVRQITAPSSPTQAPKFQKFISNDRTVSENYGQLVYDTISTLYDEKNAKKMAEELREELIGGLRNSMKHVFGDLLLNNISDPLRDGSFYFEKGEVKAYHYKNLSGGEKAAFDLLLDLHVKKKHFTNAIYCIDEIEAHLHTKVQKTLLLEILKIIPDLSQLWITTHSLGVLRAAQEIENISPNSVCVIDFEEIKPDEKCEITPSSLGQITWDKMFSITLDDLSERIVPETIVVCEGSPEGNRRKDFDAKIYNRIFGPHIHDIQFISGGSSNEVPEHKSSVSQIMKQILPGTKVVAVLDRDDRTPENILELQQEGIIVLPVRNIESFLFADDVIRKLIETRVNSEEQEDIILEILELKTAALQKNPTRPKSKPVDDLKSASGDIYVGIKRIFNREEILNFANDPDTLMRDILAPLITPTMSTYKEMEDGIINKIRNIIPNN